ncbi:MAG: hypothetical protein N4A65_00360 [Cohaesibacter sp.]|jgi:hypothetical protein|nr:hypothetical protein [Cohaesibacter sp.]
MTKFGDWRPDASDFNTGVLSGVVNAQPVLDGWAPVPSFVPYSEALPDKPRGSCMARRRDGGYIIYAGTLEKLYRLDPATRNWVEVGSGYHLSEGDTWSFQKFGTDLVAANVNDFHQVVDIEANGEFSDLNQIKSRSLCVIGPNLFALGLIDVPDGVAWSETRNIRNWNTFKKGSGSNQLLDGGYVLAGYSGEKGSYLFQKDAVQFVTWQPGQAFNFRFDEIASTGLVGPHAAVKVNQTVFFLAQDGFYSLMGGQLKAIGAGKVDNSFLKDINLDKLVDVCAVSDPLNKVVYWAYASSGYTEAGYDKIVGYDWQLGRWFQIEANIQLLARAATPGHSADSLDQVSATVEALNASFDSPAWSGGKPVLAAFDDENRLCFAHGANLRAMFETGDNEFNPGYRSLLTSCALASDCSDASLEVGTKATANAAAVWKPEVIMQASGRFPCKANGKFHRFRISLEGAWSSCHGLSDIEVRRAGRR